MHDDQALIEAPLNGDVDALYKDVLHGGQSRIHTR
ncbi:hypothetical protein J2S11_001808 [Bacillus horti]|uniref:Uncharacterized protein n=1 Tax=Caldalkalibacillus horti TaxID=77523 RepID=A0ABT9VY35_9BACI|nr:hypothetical protein [Bacillus horti]